MFTGSCQRPHAYMSSMLANVCTFTYHAPSFTHGLRTDKNNMVLSDWTWVNMGYQKISWLIGWSSFPPLIWMGRDWGPAGNLEAKKEQVMLKCWFALMAKPLLHPVDQTYPNKISWLLVSTPLTNISQLERLFPIYGKIKAMFQTTDQYLKSPASDSCAQPEGLEIL